MPSSRISGGQVASSCRHSAAISAVFVATLGISHVHVVAGLLVGGVVAAPFAAWLTRRLPARPLMAAVGVLVVLLSLYNLSR